MHEPKSLTSRNSVTRSASGAHAAPVRATNAYSSDLSAEQLREALNYDPETGAFTWLLSPSGPVRAGSAAGSKDSRGYVCIRLGGKAHKAHRLAWLYVNGEWPETDIDHANRNRADNRFVNLRLATKSENKQNSGRSVNNTSGQRGIYWCKLREKWAVHISVGNRRLHLGRYISLDDATAARKSAELKYHQFALSGVSHA